MPAVEPAEDIVLHSNKHRYIGQHPEVLTNGIAVFVCKGLLLLDLYMPIIYATLFP